MAEHAVKRPVQLIRTRTGDGIDHGAGAAHEFGRVAGGLDLKVLDALDALGNEGDETLAPHPDIYVVVVRSVDGEAVTPSTKAVHRELAGSPDSQPDGRSRTAGKGNPGNAGGSQGELVEGPEAAQGQVLNQVTPECPPQRPVKEEDLRDRFRDRRLGLVLTRKW